MPLLSLRLRRHPAAAVYADRRILAVLLLGFASGLPLALTGGTLSVWLAELGVAKTAIGLFALAGTPYTVKFLWAPLIDRLPLPPFTHLLGRRRGWAAAIQLALIGAILALGGHDPAADPWGTALLAFAVAFLSASQDVVIDAWRVEILEERQQGAGAAVIVLGYRLGMLASGAGALLLAEWWGWGVAYLTMAALMGVGLMAVLASAEPQRQVSRESRAREERVAQWLAGGAGGRLLAWLHAAVVSPFADFAARPGWLAILLFILLYKFGDALAGVMSNPFYIELGFSKGEIAEIGKAFGLAAAIGGGLLGGAAVGRWGVVRSLLVCGVLQMLSNLMFALLAVKGHDLATLTLTIAVENLSGGMGTAAFVAYLSGLCNVAYTATQYALLSSLTAFGRNFLASGGGWLADRLDWVGFFVATTFAALPGLLLLWWMTRRFVPPAAAAVETEGPR